MEISTMAEAKLLHAQLLKTGFNQTPLNCKNFSRLFTFTALSTSGDRSYARLILDSLEAPTNSYYHNTMIRAYSEEPNPFQSLMIFLAMHLQDPPFIIPRPDKFTYPFVLKACGRLKDAQMGKRVHGLICKAGLSSDRHICNALIHMYSECGDLECACKVFDGMSDRDVVSWSTMIDGFVRNGRPVEAVELFREMENNIEVRPNDATIVLVLKACAETGALEFGRRLHRIVDDLVLGSKANVCTALVDMYAKSGCIDSAKKVFNGIANKDIFTWTAMIHGLANHGMCEEAINLFDQMENSGIKPDERALTAVLSACRNACWIDKGYLYFENMQAKYGVQPNIQHYGCVIDLFARAGRLDKAEELIEKMQVLPDSVLWRTVLWACKVHGDTERAEHLMKQIDMHDDNGCDSYILLGNIYASSGKWQDKANVRKAMAKGGLVKQPGTSRIEVEGFIHEFTAGDSSHYEAEGIYEKLDEIEKGLRGEGYEPEISEVLLEIEDEEKASQLLHHSEKLALAFGLLKMDPNSQIRIVKNLRSCEDCHTFMKMVSKVYKRDIVVRDRIRFHYFRNGNCSCRDYW